MKIKKSNLDAVVQWIDVKLAKDDKFPFDLSSDKGGSSKASKKNLKALKAWRKCSNNTNEVREWCEEWLDEKYETTLLQVLEHNNTHKADQILKITLQAFDLLTDQADKQGLSPSELIVAHLSEKQSQPSKLPKTPKPPKSSK
jgi:hypothetical protein